jgi:hypothetical protein
MALPPSPAAGVPIDSEFEIRPKAHAAPPPIPAPQATPPAPWQPVEPPAVSQSPWQPPPIAMPAPPRSSPVLILVILALLAAASAGGWWYWTHREPAGRLGQESEPGLPAKAPQRDPNRPIPLPKPTEVQPLAPAPPSQENQK